jgi:hypothetical protein
LKKIKTLKKDFAALHMQGGFFVAIPDIRCIGTGHFLKPENCLICCETVGCV